MQKTVSILFIVMVLVLSTAPIAHDNLHSCDKLFLILLFPGDSQCKPRVTV